MVRILRSAEAASQTVAQVCKEYGISEQTWYRWKSKYGQMVLRWAMAAFLETEKHFRKIGGYKQLWMLKAYLDELETEQTLAQKGKAG
ncbi:MAG: transposase [Smithella sp.]|nr:transposase [Smithella sp.]